MNVGVFSWIIDRQRTGVDNYLYYLIQTMITDGKGDQLSLIHCKESDDKIYDETNEIMIPNLPKRLREMIGLPYGIMKCNLDILHVPTHFHTQLTPFFLNRNVKKILTIHDIIPLLFPETYGGNLASLWVRSLKIIKNRPEMFLVDSNNTKRDCIRHLGIEHEKIKVVPLAAPPSFRPFDDLISIKSYLIHKYQINTPFILSVGRLEARKNFVPLIKAIHHLKNEGLNFSLVLIGGMGWKHEEVIESMKDLGLEENVIFPGYVSEEDLVKFYNAADLFVYPSLYEGFGLPPLEAMACGTPVITSNTSSLPEVVGEAGIMVDPHDDQELTKAMHKVLTNENLSKKLGQKGLERSKCFTWEKTASETWKVYEEVLNRQ